MDIGTGHSQRLMELSAGEAAGELSAAEREELDALMQAVGPSARLDFFTIAALVQVAFLKREPTAMRRVPRRLALRLLRMATEPVPTQQHLAAPGGRPRRAAEVSVGKLAQPWGRAGVLGWCLAASLALALVVLRLDTSDRSPASVAPAEGRAALLQSAGDLLLARFAQSAAPGLNNATGDVVWSSARQEGYLRLAGLPRNDPARQQYQLWIVDPDRDAHPVDGGVFDVSTAGTVTIPIHAKLRVGNPTAFAITSEQPGGVVVSDGPLLLVASATG